MLLKSKREVSGGLLKIQRRGQRIAKKVGGRERKIYSFDLIKTYENDALHKPKKLQTF